MVLSRRPSRAPPAQESEKLLSPGHDDPLDSVNRRSSVTGLREDNKSSGATKYVATLLGILALGMLVLKQFAGNGLPTNLPQSWLARVLARSNAPPLKVYMYDMPDWLDKDVRAMVDESNGWLNRSRVYDADIWVYDFISTAPFRTNDPGEADLFYIPIYPDLYLQQQMLSHNYSEAIRITSEEYVRPALEYLGYTMPYWKRMQGRDHFTTLSANLGRCVHFSALKREEIQEMFVLQHLGDLDLVNNDEVVLRNTGAEWPSADGQVWPCYKKGRDILIPPFLEQAGVPVLRPQAKTRKIKTLLRFNLISKQQALLYARTNVRQSLSDLYEKGLIQGADWRINDFVGTLDDMANAVTSVDPPGENPVNTRFWWTILRGCIPISYRRDRDLPFQDQLNYPSFNINIDPYNVNSTHAVLDRLFSQPQRLAAMQKALAKTQDKLAYTSGSGVATLLTWELQQQAEKTSRWLQTSKKNKPACNKLSDIWTQCW